MGDIFSLIIDFLGLYNYDKPLSFLKNRLKSHYYPIIAIAGMLISFYSVGMLVSEVPAALKEAGYSLWYFFFGLLAAFGYFILKFFTDRKKIENKVYRAMHLLTFISVCYVFAVVGYYVGAMLPYAEAMGWPN